MKSTSAPKSGWLHLKPYLWMIPLLCGIVLRLVWVSDMEYKYDESFMFHQSQVAGATEPFPWVGMPSGVQLRNPGLSIWIFIGLARLFHLDTPESLTMAVRSLAAISLLFLFGFGFLHRESTESRKVWLWTAALASVNVFSVLFSRKIWAQDMLPIFCVSFLFSWWYRRRRFGAFGWGLVGALLGQIHMSGFFYAGAFAAFTYFFSRKSLQWKYWLLGSVLGALPLIPWLFYLAQALHQAGSDHKRTWEFLWNRVGMLAFFKDWLLDSSALGVGYSLGDRDREFYSSPFIFGRATYGVALATAVTAGTSVLGILKWFKGFKISQIYMQISSDDDALAIASSFLGMGLLITISNILVYRHYLIVTFPFEFLFLVLLIRKTLKKSDLWLSAIWVAHVLITISFLVFLHTNCGAKEGDYGVAYRCQATGTHENF